MTEGTDDSDGLDDTEFQAEHEKYLEDTENRTLEVLKQEEERLNVRKSCFRHANVIFYSKSEMWLQTW